MAMLSLRCGLRFGEITTLRRMDIDLENGVINIADPKNTTARKAFITAAVKEVLEARLPEYPEEYIFTTDRARRLENCQTRSTRLSTHWAGTPALPTEGKR